VPLIAFLNVVFIALYMEMNLAYFQQLFIHIGFYFLVFTYVRSVSTGRISRGYREKISRFLNSLGYVIDNSYNSDMWELNLGGRFKVYLKKSKGDSVSKALVRNVRGKANSNNYREQYENRRCLPWDFLLLWVFLLLFLIENSF